jgi:hypothetical protein
MILALPVGSYPSVVPVFRSRTVVVSQEGQKTSRARSAIPAQDEG